MAAGSSCDKVFFFQLPTALPAVRKKLRVVVSNHQRRSGRQQFGESVLNCCFIDTPRAYGANKYGAADSWKTREYETQSFLVTPATRAQITVCARYGGLGGALYTC